MSFQLKKEIWTPDGVGYLKSENREVEFRGKKFIIDFSYYQTENGVDYSDNETDNLNYNNTLIKYGEVITLEKLSCQVHTLPTLRNKLSPISNLLEMLTMDGVKIDYKDKDVLKIIIGSIDMSKKMVRDIAQPSHLSDPFYDIEL